jgi:pilus assembly protein TadC
VSPRIIAALFALVMIVILLAIIAYVMIFGKKESEMDVLLRSNRDSGMSDARSAREALRGDSKEEEEYKLEQLKDAQRKSIGKGRKTQLTEEERYYRAGIFTEQGRREFERVRYTGAALCGPLLCIGAFFFLGDPLLAAAALLVGSAGGYISVPSVMLDKRMVRRKDEILYYLPLVIEQVAIGVSSSLDTGPALSRVVQMADERDTHNAVTELVRHVELMIRSGLSLQEALIEVGLNSGSNELKHTFMALAQVSKHGGEISKQLMELANSVSQARENQIDENIRKLELKATGPVAMVFFGFMIILLIGFGMNIKNAL